MLTRPAGDNPFKYATRPDLLDFRTDRAQPPNGWGPARLLKHLFRVFISASYGFLIY